MVGFILGAAAAVVAMKFLRHRHGWGGGPFGPWRHGRGGYGRRWILGGLYDRLRTSPSQERVIEQAVDEVSDAFSRLRDEKHRSREDIARALKEERFDAASLNDTFSRHDAALSEIRKTLTAALGKVHEVLDLRQRSVLAETLQYGGGFGGGCGWRRGHGHRWHGGGYEAGYGDARTA